MCSSPKVLPTAFWGGRGREVKGVGGSWKGLCDGTDWKLTAVWDKMLAFSEHFFFQTGKGGSEAQERVAKGDQKGRFGKTRQITIFWSEEQTVCLGRQRISSGWGRGGGGAADDSFRNLPS